MKGYARWAQACLVGVAFLAPLKFGTPIILQASLVPPMIFSEWVFFTWPNQLATLATLGVLVWLVLDRNRLAARVDWLFLLPLLFLFSQLLAAPCSISPQATVETLLHFAVCVLLFYAAAWYVRDGAVAARIFGAFGLATFLILIFALEQRFGGLQQTRDYAAAHAGDLPSDLKLRLTSDRVFATLVYPNALAGYLVLAYAPVLAWIWVRARVWDARVKWLTLVLVGGLMVVCLALTGSRGGFVALVASVLTGLVCFGPQGLRRTRWVVVVFLAIGGVFLIAKRTGVVHLGTESMAARWDYWQGAVRIARDYPWFGTGPGTFGSIYMKYKTATTEEAQFVHNNYLQMWSDSGLAGFVIFALLWLVGLRDGIELARQRRGDPASIAICAAIAGWVVHGMMDFDMYVPGVALPAFILLGIMQGLKELPKVETVPMAGRRRWPVGLVCVAVVAFVAWGEGRSLAAVFLQGQAHRLVATNPVAAAEKARQAIDLVPRNARYRAAAGELAMRLGRLDEAIQQYEFAIVCDPYRPGYHWRLARVLMMAGGRESQALEQLKLANQLNPTNRQYQQALVEVEESIRQRPASLLESPPANGGR